MKKPFKTRLRNMAAGGAMVLTAAGSLAVTHNGAMEGLRLVAYKDIVGVWTACYGETKGMGPGMRFTKDKCDVMFTDSLIEHEQGMRECLNNPDALPDKVYVAYLSGVYNYGVGAFCKSSIARLANAGNLRASCGAIMAYVFAGKKVVPGLVKRREKERQMCLDGLA
jgi:lysozyme